MGKSRCDRSALGRRLRQLRGSTIHTVGAGDNPEAVNLLGGPLIRRTSVKRPSELETQVLPLKNVRLKQLVDARFNCPDFLSFLRGELNVVENVAKLKEFWKKHGRITLRNFKEERLLDPTPKLPVAYDKSEWTFILAYCKTNNQQYHTLVNEALPLSDSRIAGNILLCDEENHAVSYFEGHGTPRYIDEGRAVELKGYRQRFGGKTPQWVPQEIEELVAQLREFRPDFRPMIVEFSIYPYAVGTCKRREILWEWRSGYATT